MKPIPLSRPDGTVRAWECSTCGQVRLDERYAAMPGGAQGQTELCCRCYCHGQARCHPMDGPPCGAPTHPRRGVCDACAAQFAQETTYLEAAKECDRQTEAFYHARTLSMPPLRDDDPMPLGVRR